MKIFAVICIPVMILAQNENLTIDVSVGGIRTLYSKEDPEEAPLYAFYPEVSASKLVRISRFNADVRIALSLGLWDDLVSKPFPVKDAETYSYRSYLGGIRCYFYFIENKNTQRFMNLMPFIGGTLHLIKADHIGSDYYKRFYFFSYDAGLRGLLKYSESTNIVLENRLFFHFYDYDKYTELIRYSITIGISRNID